MGHHAIYASKLVRRSNLANLSCMFNALDSRYLLALVTEILAGFVLGAKAARFLEAIRTTETPVPLVLRHTIHSSMT